MPGFIGNDAPGIEAESPLTLAVSAILALVPHPNVQDSGQESHVELRRRTAHCLAKRALESIESDSEMPDSAISPAQALAHGKRFVSRQPFHPKVPVELEGSIALCILSIYEYVQRGNIGKMRDRAGQALMSAMNLSLHSRGTESDQFSEAKRRTWWMTVRALIALRAFWESTLTARQYVCVCQASIVSCTVGHGSYRTKISIILTALQAPTISPLDPRFTTSYPSNEYDREVCRPRHQVLTLVSIQLTIEGLADFHPIPTNYLICHAIRGRFEPSNGTKGKSMLSVRPHARTSQHHRASHCFV